MKPGTVESPYRKVETHTWDDARFRRLSALPPCGQGLWFYLLTNPHTVAVPGLYSAGRAAMAEELGWSLEAFDKAFAEAFAEGMVEADWIARVVWLPNALRPANKPESPNAAIAWRKAVDRVPDCDLKRQAVVQIRRFLANLGSSYLQAFDTLTAPKKASSVAVQPSPEPLGKASVKPSRKPSRKPSVKPWPKTPPNQEQEQDLLRERDTPRVRQARAPRAREAPRRRLPVAFEWARGCVPQALHVDLVAKLGGDPTAAAAQLQTLYREVARTWPDTEPVDGNDWAFWRARFAERFGGTTTGPRDIGQPARRAPQPHDVWGRVLARLEASLNRHTFRTWLVGTSLLRDAGDHLVVAVPDGSHGAWIARHYHEPIATALEALGRGDVRVEFEAEARQAVHA